MSLLLLPRITAFALLVVVVSVGPAVLAAHGGSSDSPGFSESWILVRMHHPVPEVAEKGYASRTGVPALDAVLAEEGVIKIDSAIPISLREVRSTEALRRHGLDRTYRFHVAEGKDVRTVRERLSQHPDVVYAELDYVLKRAATIPDDPLFPVQWALNNTGQTGGAPDADVDAPEGWDISIGEPIVVAVIDSGVDATHVEFEGKLVPGWDFAENDPITQDEDGHGTAMSSIIAANTDNAAGIAGVCWNCRIMPLRAHLTSHGADALVWAVDHGARVVNISQYNQPSSPTLGSALAYAYDAGVVVVACSGNEGITPIGYPARYVESIAVGATNSSDERANPFCSVPNTGSNYGPRLDVVAPGEQIVAACSSTAPGCGPDDYYTTCLDMSGTSPATALVTGIAGLVRSLYPSVGRLEMRHLMRSAAEDQVGDPVEDIVGADWYYGWGRVNADRSVRGAASGMSLRLEGAESTRLHFDMPSPLADSYDFIRGDLGALSEQWQGVGLGEVVCLENDSPDPDTAGNADDAIPLGGKAFFYLARINTAVGAGSYGGSTRNRDRRVPQPVSWTRDGEQDGAEYGYAVAGAGDVNGDGYNDVVVGARGYTDDQPSEGGAFLYLGSADGLMLEPAWIGRGNQADSGFGTSVGSAGDVNGDGYDDIVVGAPYHSNGQTQEGRAYVFLGSAAGRGAEPDWTVESDQAFARFGERVTSAGDVNGDGYDDVLVTAPQFDAGQNNEGKAFLYFGSSSGLTDVPWTFESNQDGARLGFGGGSAGDVNGDGYDDLIIGAHRYSGPEIDEGRLFLFLGSPFGPSSPPTTLEIDVPGARLGRAAATAGDVNGDGYSDIIAGAVFFSGTESQEGAVFVYSGSPFGVSTSPSWSFASGQAEARLGTAAATAGDINGDGFADVIVGADAFDSERTDEGAAWLFLGSATGLEVDPNWIAFGGQSTASFGWAVAGAGNVNGDESSSQHPYDDIVIGAYGYDEDSYGVGRVLVYHGSATGPPVSSDCAE